jgi:hypothetical protein
MAEPQYGVSKVAGDIKKSAGKAVAVRQQKRDVRQQAGKNAQANLEAFFSSKPSPGSVSNKPKPTFSYDRPAGLMGSADVMERRIQANKAGKPLYGRDQGREVDPMAELKAMLDAMMGGSGGGGGGGSARAYSDAQIAAAQARLQAIYGRYADDIAAQEAAIGRTYDTAGTSLGSIYDTSVGNINKAYDAAREAQTQQLLNLGMTEQTPVQSFGNQTAATSSLQNLRAAVLAQNEASRKASITNQRLSAEAARREGAENAARLAAEMQQAMVSTGGGGGGGGGGGLSPYQYASLMMKGQENEFNRQKAAQEFALKSQPQSQPNLQAALDAAAKFKGTPDQLKIADFFYGKV